MAIHYKNTTVSPWPWEGGPASSPLGVKGFAGDQGLPTKGVQNCGCCCTISRTSLASSGLSVMPSFLSPIKSLLAWALLAHTDPRVEACLINSVSCMGSWDSVSSLVLPVCFSRSPWLLSILVSQQARSPPPPQPSPAPALPLSPHLG